MIEEEDSSFILIGKVNVIFVPSIVSIIWHSECKIAILVYLGTRLQIVNSVVIRVRDCKSRKAGLRYSPLST